MNGGMNKRRAIGMTFWRFLHVPTHRLHRPDQRRGAATLAVLGIALVLAACSTSHHEYARPSPHYKVGAPYKINGRWYRPAVDPTYDEVGVASWYGPQFHGRKTANGEIFDMNRLSAAHTTLPMPSMAEVENLDNGRRVVVRINDRGPFADDRLIDLSREAARRLGFMEEGLARVRVRYVGPAPLRAQAPVHPGEAARDAAYASRRHDARHGAGARIVNANLDAPPRTVTVLQSAVEFAPEPRPASAPEAASGPASELAPARIASAGDETGDKLYVIRVAALSTLDNLDRLEAQMDGIGPLRLSRIETAENKTLYRVTMGPFASAAAAESPLDAVRRAGYRDAVIVAVTP